MSTSFPLPLECLQLIILLLVQECDSNTLYSLLQTNKYICSATIPLLYKDPFRIVKSKRDSDGYSMLSELIRIILRSMPDGHVSDLLRAAYLQESLEPGYQRAAEPSTPTTTTTTTTTATTAATRTTTTIIPYYSFVTSVGFKPSSRLPFSIFMGVDDGFLDYLERYGHKSRYLLECSVMDKFDRESDDWMVQYTAGQEICRDLTWALSMDAERVKTLSIPLSDITHYLPLVSRFEVVTDVTFLLHRDARPAGEWQQSATLEQQEAWKMLQMERPQQLEAMILFVQEHRGRLPGALATGRCSRLIEGFGEKDCPEEYQLRLLQALPPLTNPRSLDSDNWTHFVVQAKNTDLSFVRTFEPPSTPLYEHFAQEPFLHRCRTLESITMDFSGDDDTFQWAVDERIMRNAYITAGRHSRLPQQPLVPLRHFAGSHGALCTGRHVNDVAFAFCDTIETIDVTDKWTWDHGDEAVQKAPEILTYYYESLWSIPRLSTFKVSILCKNLRIEPSLLSRCPQLVTVSLHDCREEYVMGDIEYWKPAELPRLTTLDLQGTPAISFHPDILKSTPELRSLCLLIYHETLHNSFIPPPEDFVRMDMGVSGETTLSKIFSTYTAARRPVWTWDWDLPKLTKLTLESEHAYRFQFRMLGGTPSLVELSINSRSLSGLHGRTIGLADLLKSGTVSSSSAQILIGSGEVPTQEAQESVDMDMVSTSTSGQKPEYVHVPALKIFDLRGLWVLDDPAVLEVLCSKVMPKVSELIMVDGCDGFSLTEWVELTSSHLHLLMFARIRMATTLNEVKGVGLGRMRGVPSYPSRYTLVNRPKGRIPKENAVYAFYD